MKKIKKFIEENKFILIVLSIAFLIRLLFFFSYHSIWWDSAVYVGMGKYIFSLGKQGLWEPIRPIVWPIILGFLWKIKLNPIFFGRLLNIIMSLGIIYLVHYIAKQLYEERTALIALIMISFSSIFFFFNYRLYTEIPAILFVLLAFFFYLKERFFFTGLFLSLSFLTKFPAGIFFVCFLAIILWKKQFKGLSFLFYGFLIPFIPYLILNQKLYGNFLFPFISASQIIKKVVGCTVLRYNPGYMYFIFILKDNILNLFVVFGIYNTIRRYNKDRILLILLFLLPLIYFIQIPCREYRYILIFLPFISILTAKGISDVVMRKIDKKHSMKVFVLLILISIGFLFAYYFSAETEKQNPVKDNFYRFAEDRFIPNEVWITNPLVGLYLDKRADLLYYEVYDVNTIFNFQQYMGWSNISYVFLDVCGGGMSCAPYDTPCKEKTRDFIKSFSSYSFTLVYNETYGICDYYIFRK